MAYITQDDLEDVIGADTLIDLTDDTDTGAVDAGKMAAAIANAEATINAKIQGLYTVPLTAPTDFVKLLDVYLTVANLYGRRSEELPEEVADNKEWALEQLQQIQEGNLDLGISRKTGATIIYHHSQPRRFQPYGNHPRTSPPESGS